MAIDIAGQKLLERFADGGFTSLVNDEPLWLSEYLSLRGKDSGMEAFCVLSDVVRRVYLFFLEHDERGGVAVDFVNTLDQLTFKYLPVVRSEDPGRGVRAAINLQAQVLGEIDRYDPRDYSV